MKSKNLHLLEEFTAFCNAHPEQRFWQALRNWSGNAFVIVSQGMTKDYKFDKPVDTFYWE